jgi:hypothetical protein
MENLIVFTESDLRKLIREEMAGIAKTEPKKKEYYSIDEAVKYLNDKGLSISKPSLYQHTAKGTIEYGRAGERKLVFTEQQLDDFIEKMIRI